MHVLASLISLTILTCSQALENGLAGTPPMGWISWERYRCITNCTQFPEDCISDRLIRRTTDLLSNDGYLEAGYEYLIIDDCWFANDRDDEGRLQPDPYRFPYGMKNLSDYIHSKGLKLGLYANYGTKTCAGYPGSMGFLETDAKTFAHWEVDYVKFDGCNTDIFDLPTGYIEFGKRLNETGRPMVYSCSMAAYFEYEFLPANYTLLSEICNLWRNWKDIQDSYSSLEGTIDWFSAKQYRIAKWGGRGHWNDPDMLIIGNYGLSYEQSKTQMALWAILAAPLLMSTNLETIRPEFKELLLHKEIISINQDALGIQGTRVTTINQIDVWTRPIHPIKESTSTYAIVFHSRRNDGYAYPLSVNLKRLRLNNTKGYVVNNVFENNDDEEEVLQLNDNFEVKVPPSGVILLKAVPII